MTKEDIPALRDCVRALIAAPIEARIKENS
jgi:hypothetical protein